MVMLHKAYEDIVIQIRFIFCNAYTDDRIFYIQY